MYGSRASAQLDGAADACACLEGQLSRVLVDLAALAPEGSEVGGQKSEVRSQRSEVRGRRSEDRSSLTSDL